MQEILFHVGKYPVKGSAFVYLHAGCGFILGFQALNAGEKVEVGMVVGAILAAVAAKISPFTTIFLPGTLPLIAYNARH